MVDVSRWMISNYTHLLSKKNVVNRKVHILSRVNLICMDNWGNQWTMVSYFKKQVKIECLNFSCLINLRRGVNSKTGCIKRIKFWKVDRSGNTHFLGQFLFAILMNMTIFSIKRSRGSNNLTFTLMPMPSPSAFSKFSSGILKFFKHAQFFVYTQNHFGILKS